MKKSISNKVFTAFAVLLMLISIGSVAQTKIDSPYSRYGLGDINQGYNAFQMSMGGVSYGVIDPHRISTINPASYSKIDSGSFVFNAAFNGVFVKTKTADQSGSSSYFNLGSLKFALPVTKWLRVSGGLLPFSSVGYNVNTYSKQDSTGSIKSGHIGDGGITNIYLGSSIKISKKLSLGFNVSYLFGKINLSKQNELQDLPKAYRFRIKNTVNVSAVHLDFGLQYETFFGKNDKYFLGLGAVYAPQQSLNASESSLATTFITGNGGFELVKDTILDVINEKGTIVVPQKIGGGFSIGENEEWVFAADVTFEEYSKFKMFGSNDNLTNSIRYNVGGRYFIGRYSIIGGFMYNNSYLNLNNTDINEIGISFGVGVPLRSNAQTKSVSYLDIGIEMGRRGTIDNSLIQQEYIKVKLGINIKNKWFRRPKYL